MVTGGAGFIGSTLVDRLLAEGWQVDAVDDLSTGSLANLANARSQPDRRFSFHRIDVASPGVIDLIAHRRPDVVFHLAAQADVRVSVARPVFDATVNILGTLNVCEGAVAAGVGKVVFAASGGNALRHHPTSSRFAKASRNTGVALRRRQEGRRRLPLLLPHDPRPRVHRARAGQRVRPAPGPARRGGRRRRSSRASCSATSGP